MSGDVKTSKTFLVWLLFLGIMVATIFFVSLAPFVKDGAWAEFSAHQSWTLNSHIGDFYRSPLTAEIFNGLYSTVEIALLLLFLYFSWIFFVFIRSLTSFRSAIFWFLPIYTVTAALLFGGGSLDSQVTTYFGMPVFPYTAIIPNPFFFIPPVVIIFLGVFFLNKLHPKYNALSEQIKYRINILGALTVLILSIIVSAGLALYFNNLLKDSIAILIENRVAYRDATEISSCQKGIGREGRVFYDATCLEYVAVNTRNISVCDIDMGSAVTPWFRQSCYYKMASELNDPNVCNKLSQGEFQARERTDCQRRYLVDHVTSIDQCDRLGILSLDYYRCVKRFAVILGDHKICEKYSYPNRPDEHEERAECYAAVSHKLDDVNVCKSMPLDASRPNLSKYLCIKEKNNLIALDLISTDNQPDQSPTQANQTNQTNQQSLKQVGNQVSQSSPVAKEKVFRSPLANTPAPITGKPLTLYDPLLEAWFEGYDRLYYEFSYPESDFSITTSADNRKITIKEIATGMINTVNISYEGGRGYTSQDYWNYTLKPSCPTCEPAANPISIKDVQGLATFANKDKEWIIFSGPSAGGGGAWLFAAELQKPTTEAEKILSTFTFVSAK